MVGVGWSVADVLCAVLEKVVILSKQVGIKQVASGCVCKQRIWTVDNVMTCCVLSAIVDFFTLQHDLSV